MKQISEASHSGEEKANFVINGVDITNVYFLALSLNFINCYVLFKNDYKKMLYRIKFILILPGNVVMVFFLGGLVAVRFFYPLTYRSMNIM